MPSQQTIQYYRRQFIRNTAIGTFGLSLPALLQMESAADATNAPRRDRRPKSLIFLFLYGGPSQIDTWDMKPDAPVEYRGEFSSIPTTLPGLRVVEYLPRLAQLARHFSVIRTLHHVNRNHQPAGSWFLTGVNPRSDNASQLRTKPTDPPALGSIAARLAPTTNSAVPPFIMLPARLNDQGSFFQAQTGGWLGSAADPLLIQQDANQPDFRVDGFEQRDEISADRMNRRRQLLATLDRSTIGAEAQPRAMDQFRRQAFDLIAGGRGASAFNLDAEPPRVRERYGRNMFGQGCLLARRLIEAGARVVTVSDCTSAGHHEWDTHRENFTKLRNPLLPRLDLSYSALMEDLLQRGMLEDTVVYLGGEFGRTPRVGQGGFSGTGATPDGRDHYPSCFPGIIAGGRIRPGVVHGQSDSRAAFPSRDPVRVADLAATIFAAMNLDPHGLVYTPENRPMPITEHGRPIEALLS